MPRRPGRPRKERPVSDTAPMVEAVPDTEAIVTEVVSAPPDERDAAILDLMAKLQEVQRDRGNVVRVNAVVDALGKLSIRDYPELVDHPAIMRFIEDFGKVQTDGRPKRPGEVINKGTIAENVVPWSYADLKGPPLGWDGRSPLPPGHTQWVIDQPIESNKVVIVNGMQWRFFRRVPYTGPKVFYDQYLEALNGEEAAAQHAAFMMKAEGAGVPQDPTIVGQGTLSVRGSFQKGSYFPGMGTAGMRSIPSQPEGEVVEETAAAAS